ncbi:MAG TPA: hypothetical protein VGB93_14055 [Methylovirgula sp.]
MSNLLHRFDVIVHCTATTSWGHALVISLHDMDIWVFVKITAQSCRKE